MSSGEEDRPEGNDRPQGGWKKRRLQGACDGCRRKKVKCDSGTMPDGQCTNCRSFGATCTHDEPPKKRGPKSHYVTKLEHRILELEKQLKTHQESPETSSLGSPPQDVPDLSSDTSSDKDQDLSFINLMDSISKLSLHNIDGRYFGPASNLSLAHHAFEKLRGPEEIPGYSYKKEHWKNWSNHVWEAETEIKPKILIFPPPDLLVSLISLYFMHFHVYIPLFHQPSFRQSVAAGLHHRDVRFGHVVLLVCAIASRASDDPRVFLDDQLDEHSSGWKYYVQVNALPRGHFDRPNIHDLQHCCLSAEYLMGTSSPQSSWTLIGLGIRYAIEMGVHRHRPGPPNAESELRKRAFWTLILMDRHLGFYHGRPSAIQHEDFDLEYPIACDDEYWDTFQQPEEKPCTIDYFICHLKLCHIMSLGLRTLYTIRRPKDMNALHVLTQLDSMLNAWFSSIPQHLVWDSHRQTTVFFDQSAVLHSIWYNVQIQIHRPFILPLGTEISSQSIAITRSASRSCARVLDAQRERGRLKMFGFASQMSAFTAGIVLALAIFSHNKTGWKTDTEQADFDKCINILRATAKRWVISGRLIDILQTLHTEVLKASAPAPPLLAGMDEIGVALSGGHPTSYHDEAQAFYAQTNMFPLTHKVFWTPEGYSYPIEDVPMDFQSTDPALGLTSPLKPGEANVWQNMPMGFNYSDWGTFVDNMAAGGP
ncbi:hypothetical protein CYLTODRAFT_387421 [Cylindrobasidium torrendii FP15055 ss-10]|uniref:Zn(2)-C6 fungal-type domain-containing protein n=1 Tax=Cylindrobasidium torrendii FP15055 ss-10 TaxID=1314674 RepID=A0A0D7BTS8_9AGAR|nr:hypothetical protein CYLTODRAFT_387421 [Cylindrobasidium torrendii FP15055 ss-10]